MKAWHFLKADRRLAYPPYTPVLIGQKITVDPDKLELCTYGLHASIRALDALCYAPGPIICRVELGGRILTENDKVCASERTVIVMADAADTLRAFARACALDVIDKWEAPAVVREFLETGNEELRESARLAAGSAARSAAELAAGSAAVGSAVWSAESAAESAAELAAGSAAWSARSAARSAAQSAARSAAELAAGSAESAAESAARSARSAWSAWSAQNERLEAMLLAILGEKE